MTRTWESRAFIVAITAPSGAGKTTVIRSLLERREDMKYSVSATTRPRREGETDGKDYFFLGEEEFSRRLEAGEFAEWAEVHGYRYGTLKSQIKETLDSGCHVVMDVDIQGARQLREAYGDSGVFIFLMPPSMEVLKHRLRRRGTEDEETLARRLRNAVGELKDLPGFQYLVVNDDLERSVAVVEGIVRAEELKVSRIPELDEKIARYLGDEWV